MTNNKPVTDAMIEAGAAAFQEAHEQRFPFDVRLRMAYLAMTQASTPCPLCGEVEVLGNCETECPERQAAAQASTPVVDTPDARPDVDDDIEALAERDGYEKAIQDIDLLTGGDGEYRYCMGNHDPERHCPDPETMKARIAERFAALSQPKGEVDTPDVEAMVKWHIPTMLRWLAENIDAPRLPDGTLTGRFLYAVAESVECRAAREATLLERTKRLEEALEPSGDTKAAYSGEFSIDVPLDGYDEDGEPLEGSKRILVPWTTIKEIMAAIRNRAEALSND